MSKIEVTIGKYTIETLTNGMYSTPLDLYREYIQNSVDSIDEMARVNSKVDECFISIYIDKKNNKISIKDNGQGICENDAVKTLIDIGNSNKKRTISRGFRGIGRLSGLGYCDKLSFTTSAVNESVKTVVVFDAKKLRGLLLDQANTMSANSVLRQVVTIKTEPEKQGAHYFSVELFGLANAEILLNENVVKDYLIQNAPLSFSKEFTWKKEIKEKVNKYGYFIPEYSLLLNGEELYKPYEDVFISDRARRNTDIIKNIEVVPLTINRKMLAILWCAETNYYGTIIDNRIKGIRIRQGNILVGDNFSCNGLFKEERFNGWLLGEVYIVSPELVINARRDGFERNEVYSGFEECFRNWSLQKSKEIRKLSYARSLSQEKKAVVEANEYKQVNQILNNSVEDEIGAYESNFIDKSESEDVAQTDYINKFVELMSQKKNHTKYTALNIHEKLDFAQKKTLERVFDIILKKYKKSEADKIINYILNEF